MLVGFFAWTACFRSFHSISIGLRSGLWLCHSKTLSFFCFNHSLVEWLVCSELLSYCMIHFLLSFSSQRDTLTFSYRHFPICWYNSELIAPSMIAWSPNHDTANLMFHKWVKVLECSVCSLPNRMLLIQAEKFTLGLIHPQNIVPIAFWLIHMAFSKP